MNYGNAIATAKREADRTGEFQIVSQVTAGNFQVTLDPPSHGQYTEVFPFSTFDGQISQLVTPKRFRFTI